jgi:uncharacterized membrane protein
MHAVKAVLRILGAIMVLMGVVWVGQGSGTFPYPASSFMIDQTPWIYYGLVLAVAGVAVMVAARRV